MPQPVNSRAITHIPGKDFIGTDALLSILPCLTIGIMPESEKDYEFYCPRCARPVTDPLACGDCSAIICRECGTPLERVDELGIG